MCVSAWHKHIHSYGLGIYKLKTAYLFFHFSCHPSEALKIDTPSSFLWVVNNLRVYSHFVDAKATSLEPCWCCATSLVSFSYSQSSFRSITNIFALFFFHVNVVFFGIEYFFAKSFGGFPSLISMICENGTICRHVHLSQKAAFCCFAATHRSWQNIISRHSKCGRRHCNGFV